MRGAPDSSQISNNNKSLGETEATFNASRKDAPSYNRRPPTSISAALLLATIMVWAGTFCVLWVAGPTQAFAQSCGGSPWNNVASWKGTFTVSGMENYYNSGLNETFLENVSFSGNVLLTSASSCPAYSGGWGETPNYATNYSYTDTRPCFGASGTQTITSSGSPSVPYNVGLSIDLSGMTFQFGVEQAPPPPQITQTRNGCPGDPIVDQIPFLGIPVIYITPLAVLPAAPQPLGGSTSGTGPDGITWTLSYSLTPLVKNVRGDFDGDGKADYAVWRPSASTWYVIPSSTPTNFLVQQWGTNGDIPVPGDYDGDGKTDFAVFRPSSGTWYVIPSNTPTDFLVQQWGTNGDIPVPGDYDGDGKTDFAVFRPSNGTWYVNPSSNPGQFLVQQWGTNGDIPVPGDYDEDGKTDFAVFRPSSGTWYVIPSNTPTDFLVQQWGTNGDIPVPGDYDGDGKTDFAVFRPSNGTWYVNPSGDPGQFLVQQWGTNGDIPVPRDYDGDGKIDYAVWRPSNGTWYVIPSSAPTNYTITQWGVSTDVPVQKPTGQ